MVLNFPDIFKDSGDHFVYTVFITNNYVAFHLWWKENLVEYQKVSKHYGAIV